MNEAEQILQILSKLRVPPQPEEYQIHELISQILKQSGVDFIHECKLSAGRRIDFLCRRTGIEVKKGRPDSSVLTAQIGKYLQCDAIDAIIVVMQRPCRLPSSVYGKPVYILPLNRLWGVALP